MRVLIRAITVGIVSSVALACGGSSSPGESQAPASTDDRAAVSTNKADYPVFPDPDAGADASVPAEQGGRGFTGTGWQTSIDYDLIGDPRAVKGGTLRQAMMTDFPSTLRYYGPNVTAWNQMLHGLVYETLLGLHPTSLEYIPALATHWQISDDRMTFKFRINPNARWADGQPVVAEDVVASWRLLVDKGLQDPARLLIYSNFEAPVPESRYIVSVKAKSENWQNFMFFSGMAIYPAHVLKTVTAAAYIKEYNYKMLPGTGPYAVAEADVAKGKSITIRRRANYWAERERRNVGSSNFDTILQLVVRDENLEFEMFKRGDLDYYYVLRAQLWMEELNYENIKRGVQQKRKIFNHNPQGVAGVAFNTRREPYNDIRVRRALRHLFNREQMVEKLMYNEYVMMDSMYPGSVYENPSNEKVRFDPQKALQLLAEAGWTQRDSAGRLTKNGRPLNIEIIYYSQTAERFFTIYQEDLRKVGITLTLRFITWEAMIKLLDERAFGMVYVGYTGVPFPDPENQFFSQLADQPNTNNLTGFKNTRADEIIAAYKTEFDFGARIKLLQELDGIVTGEHHWLLQWSGPYERVVYWNRFGQPPGMLSRIGDYRDIPSLWWIDPAKQKALEGAQKDPSVQLGAGPTDDRYWLEYARVESERAPVSR